MFHHAIPAALLALVPPLAIAAGDVAPEPDAIQSAQVTIHERIIMRLPRLGPRKPDRPIVWKEKHGPKCVAAADLAGAMVTRPDAVDLVLNGGARIRARLDNDCGPLDYYDGFYIKPAADGMICADRDVIRARSGAACQIDSFRRLVPSR